MAAAGFRKKRIHSQRQALGDKLKRARLRKKCTVKEAEDATRIRARFILALESDAWEQLPSDIYGRGYLLQYADFLGLSRSGVLKDYNKERKLLEHRCRKASESLAPARTFKLPRFFITTKVLSYTLAAFLVLVIGGYLTVQINKFAAVPVLEIASPTSADSSPLSAVLVTDPSIVVTGQTSVGAELTINNEVATVDSEGVFHHKIELSRGENVIQIKAINRSGAERVELLKVVAEY